VQERCVAPRMLLAVMTHSKLERRSVKTTLTSSSALGKFVCFPWMT